MLTLLTAVTAEARRCGIPVTGRMHLPLEPPIDAALDRLFDPTLHAGQDEGHVMARTIAADFTHRQLDAIFALTRQEPLTPRAAATILLRRRSERPGTSG